MEMHQVRYFLAVARELNFTRAAEACNVTQPSLTRAIQKLEEELGGQLFRRERALTHLSELGRLMLPHLERTYEAAQAARALARSIGRTEVAPLALGIADDIIAGRLADLLADLATALPGLEVRLTGGSSSSLVALALEGALDLLIVERPDPVPERMDVWSLFREDMQLLGPVDTPDELAAGALAGLPWIAGDSAADRALQQPGPDTQGPQVRHRATGSAQVAQLVAARLGYGLVPACLPLMPGQRRSRITDFACERDIVLATVAGRQRPVAAEAFQKAARTISWAGAD